MKIIDIRMRPPFKPYLGEGGMYDMNFTHPFSTNQFYSRFGMNLSEAMRTGSMEALFAEMDRTGDVTGVVSVRVNKNGYENDPLVDLLAQYPNRFLGACGIPSDDAETAIATIQKYIENGPCITPFMEPGFNDILFDDERIFPVYEYCEQHNIPMLISFGGFHGVTSEYCNADHVVPVAKTFPNLRMCLCHGGWPHVENAVRVAYQYANVYLSPDIYALHAAGAQSYIEAANYMLRDKFVYGSAFPCVDLESSVAHYLKVLRPEVVEDVMYNNAARFLGI